MSTVSGRPRPRKSDYIVLVDRCLPPEIAVELSKVDGIYGVPLTEQYGDTVAQGLPDVAFLADAGRERWGVLTQNPKMWRVPQERECIVEHGTRVFCLDDPSASKTLKGLVVGRHLLSMRRRLGRHEACFWRMRLQDVRKEMR